VQKSPDQRCPLLKTLLLLPLLLGTLAGFSQTDLGNVYAIDQAQLNTHILREVNAYRKKARVDSLVLKSELFAPARDHAAYMQDKTKLTHVQRFRKATKTPKNRVNLYGYLFQVVGENVQLNSLNIGASPDDKKHPRINTYELLAESLVLAWRNSPPHYANMISPDFETTYTAISVTPTGEVYACQLFGGSMYADKYEALNDTVHYRLESEKRCRWCRGRVPLGTVSVTADSSIYFVFHTKLRRPTYVGSRMRLFNPWNDGLAADIVLKSQYTCDSSSYFNGRANVRGIPLPPVYKKDFGLIGVFNTSIYLGKVPAYIEEEFEVNVTVIKNKRTCANMMFHEIPADFKVKIPLSFGFEPKDATVRQFSRDTLTQRLYFDKSQITPNDTLGLQRVSALLLSHASQIERIDLIGFSSIEGSAAGNAHLYAERARYLSDYLVSLGIDAARIRSGATENFADFRKDIVGTIHEKLGTLSDEALKERLKDPVLLQQLEPIFQRHRYVEVQVLMQDMQEFRYTAALVNEMLSNYVAQKKVQKCIEMQQVQYQLIREGEMQLADLDEVLIPVEKRFFLPLHHLAVMRFEIDSLNPGRYQRLKTDLLEIFPLDSNKVRLRTSLAILEYYEYVAGTSGLNARRYYKILHKKKRIDPVQKSRMLLNFASATDWAVDKPRYCRRVKKYISKAKLDVDKTFELATYYAYFNMNQFAYQLTRQKIDNTENPEDLIFFLKLLYMTNVKVSRSEYIRYFKRIRTYAGAQFCTFFNSPKLNFQILDDPEIKAIYCAECGH
jgi:uncharacterized protein YkwD